MFSGVLANTQYLATILGEPIPRFNDSCESFGNAEICETECGNILLECAYTCETQGQI